ncbi:MAG: hypothetical protein IPK07_07565 [Deltaproteobacteria bacterium]|nr:hypothetical protein [Deltaproteobacteria bacterium]
MSALAADPDRALRRALAASVLYNLSGSLGFLVPEPIGRWIGFPTPVPRLYPSLIAMVVLLFAAVYAWLYRARVIDRSLVALSALGKTGFFAVFAGAWWAGQVPLRAVLAVSGDLAFAVVFAWWLVRTRRVPLRTPELSPASGR